MKAIVVKHAGGPEVLETEERPIPKATIDKSVMKIRAFTVHRYEVLTRAGGSPSVHFPRVIGVEAVGEIYEPAKNSKHQKGQKVITMMGGFGRAFDGSYEEYALVPDKHLYAVDYDGSWENLATIPESFYTAYIGLNALKLKKGDKLLVRGGTTAVGVAAMKMGKALGYQVASTSRQKARLTELKELGANETILDKNGKLDSKEKFNGALEILGVSTLKDSLHHVAQGGTVSLIGMIDKNWIIKNFDPFAMLGSKYLTVSDSTFVDQAKVNAMFALINKNRIKVPISKVFTLDQIQEAHRYVMKTERPMGEVVVVNDFKD